MLAFVTVGSTRFDALVQAVLSTPCLATLRSKGYSRLIVQCGNSDFELKKTSTWSGKSLTLALEREGISIEIWHFKPTLQAEYDKADLVISHAGSGTILDVLRLHKPLIVVPNPTLLDDHQQELASSLDALGHLKASSIADLSKTIETFDISAVVPFPSFDGSRFRDLLDEEMGFAV